MVVTNNWTELWSGMEKVGFNKESYMWQFYKILLGNYDFKGKRVLEIGCGTGMNSIIMASMGAKVTFLDKTKEALNLVRGNLNGFESECELVQGDIFDYNFEKGYDIVHDEGVAEHFLGEKRQRFIDIHAEALKKGGKALIVVPNMASPAYRFGKFLAEKTRTWIFGGEYPYSRKELETRMKIAGFKTGKIIGGEFLFSFAWILSPLWLKSHILKRTLQKPATPGMIKSNYNNPFANRWGRVIGCVGEKR